jgi:hypothetical protein
VDSRRQALTIGVSRFARSGGSESDGIGGLDDLPFVPDLVEELAAALAELGYACTPYGRDDRDELSTSDLASAVRSHLEAAEADGILIVHVLSHGLPAKGDATVYVVGSDGEPRDDTDIARWLTTVENLPGRPLTLFLLDLCQSGILARLPWQTKVADGQARAWVIAASQSDRAAYDGRLTRAVIDVLRAITRGDLHVDPAYEFVPLEVVARAVRQRVNDLVIADDGYSQQVTGSLVDMSAAIDMPFFRNPTHLPSSPAVAMRAELDAGLVPFLDDLDEGLDARHFVDRAAGVGVLDGQAGLSGLVGCFTGRERELKVLSPWLNRVGPGSLSVVTGSPGVGKSALVGVLICAAHPRLREHTPTTATKPPAVRGRPDDPGDRRAASVGVHRLAGWEVAVLKRWCRPCLPGAAVRRRPPNVPSGLVVFTVRGETGDR